ncbi:MAG TPA: glycoside hydrolase family 2 protein [Clostridiales bacterium]|nr:glycoside hydrolase family 2 protein [Clostridiales bacterium]
MNRVYFNDKWTFRKEGSTEPPVSVILPHDAMLYEKRNADSPGSTGGAFYHGGKYIYEKTTYVPAEWRDKYVCLEFEGVYRNATVYINGQKVKFNAYGYVNFFVECDGFLKYGESNTITVEADNTMLPNSRWYSGSGIYRPVWLYVAEKTHIPFHGVKISTISYSPARVKVETEFTGEADVQVEILRDGVIAARGTGRETELDIPDAFLWSEESPELYECRVSLLSEGNIVDSVSEIFGIRKIEYSSKGLFINGKSVKLRGGCVHHDNGILGACAYEEAEERRVLIMKEAGFNAIRSAHNPCSEAFMRACDKYGIYLIDEMWDMWYERKNRYDYGVDFINNFKNDVMYVVFRDYNHPSVIMYSVGNENLEPFNEKGLSVLQEIVETFRLHDQTRPITMGLNPGMLFGASKGKGLYKDPIEGENAKASGSTLFNMIMMLAGVLVQKLVGSKAIDKIISPCAELLDVVGYNYASGRYQKDGKNHPGRLLYGSETMPYQIADNWSKVQQYDHVCGDFFWTAWDYLGEAGLGSWSYRNEAAGFNKKYPWKLSEAGAIDILGNIGAEAAYAGFVWGTRTKPYIAITPPDHPGEKLNKAYWRGTNAVSSWSWRGCDGNPTTVEVYASGDSIQLEVNGKTIGKKKLRNYKAKFKTLYQSGTIRAMVFDKNGNSLSQTMLSSAMDNLSISLASETRKPKAGEIVFINISLIGENGVVESNYDQTLTAQVEGGELLGFGSAEPCTEERFTSGTYTTYMGKALAAVRKSEAGALRLHVDGKDLSSVLEINFS